jgi:hypothetical protein
MLDIKICGLTKNEWIGRLRERTPSVTAEEAERLWQSHQVRALERLWRL